MTDYPALASRLGYFDKQDFCVNGFVFDAGIKYGTEGYIRDLSYGPEILMYLDDFLQMNLCLKYRECSKYYKAFIKAPIEDIIFDGKEEINTAQKKSEYFFRKVY